MAQYYQINITYPLTSVKKKKEKIQNEYLKFAFLFSVNFYFKGDCVIEIASFDSPKKSKSVISGNLAFDLRYRVCH